MDSAASDHYFPTWFRGNNHNPNNNGSPVGTANSNIMTSVASDEFDIPVLTPDTPILAPETQTCKKFIEVQLPLISVRKLSTHGLTVLFDERITA